MGRELRTTCLSATPPKTWVYWMGVAGRACGCEHFSHKCCIRFPFVLDGDDFHTAFFVLGVPGCEEGGFVDAVGAPGAADGDDDDLVVEFFVLQG